DRPAPRRHREHAGQRRDGRGEDRHRARGQAGPGRSHGGSRGGLARPARRRPPAGSALPGRDGRGPRGRDPMSIQLRSRRGPIGTAWQAVALREAAERLLGPGRASRGRTDARAGRVQWLEVEPGAARAAVEDPDGGLHQARLDLPAHRDGDREVFLQVARAHPELPARLAAGTYPEQIEAELAPSMLSLLPRDAAELSHDCDCLDWPGPCRHVSALVYVLVEAVDEHPVHLLTLRGIRLEELVTPVAPAAGAAGPPRGEDAHGSGDGPPEIGRASSGE